MKKNCHVIVLSFAYVIAQVVISPLAIAEGRKASVEQIWVEWSGEKHSPTSGFSILEIKMDNGDVCYAISNPSAPGLVDTGTITSLGCK